MTFRSLRRPSWLLCALLAAASASAVRLREPADVRPLTGPQAGEPLRLALDFVAARAPELGLTPGDVADLVVSSHHTSAPSGITHVYLRQRVDGLEVATGDIGVHVAADGSIIDLHSSFVPAGDGMSRAIAPRLSAQDAVAVAARHLGLALSAPLLQLSSAIGPAQQRTFSRGGISLVDIPARLVWQPVANGGLRLAWETSIYPLDAQSWWYVTIDAADGRELDRVNWVANDSYRVYPSPVESPIHTTPAPPSDGRLLLVNPADPVASPLGWHTTNNNPGQYTTTRGNNVDAYEDTNNSNSPTGGDAARAQGGAGRVFDFTLNLALQPSTYMPGAITNLFYWNNVMHDFGYHYGFDEAGGNFQVNNYGRGGNGGDDVQAEAQDGGGTNNANFATPADGNRPRMQMYLWDPAPGLPLTINSPAVVAGQYAAALAAFGPALPAAPGITGNLVVVNDGTALPSEGCNALVNGAQVSGNIALVDRGNCNFTIKVKNAQNAGARAVIVVNNVTGSPIAMGGTDGTITIPSIHVSLADGNAFKAQMPSPGVNGTIRDASTGVQLDGDLDAGIVAHEFGHGISNRLVGGPLNVNCLNNQEQPGEGWSDLMGLFITARATDSATVPRGIGTYAIGEPTSGGGIRDYPYTTDMAIDPRTYDEIKTTAVPHGVGSVWAAMVWEMYWALVGQYGFSSDLYNGSAGNNIAIQLVFEGMKLTPCRPGFVDNRNAILQADQNLYGGANQCLIWRAFAKRGLGFSALQGSTTSRADGTEAFDLPSSCIAPANIVVETCTDSDLCSATSTSNGIVEPGETVTYTVRLRNSGTGAASDVRADIVVNGGATVVSGGTIGGGPVINLGPGATHDHTLVVSVTGLCGGNVDIDVVNVRDATGTYFGEGDLCDRAIGGATCTPCSACAAAPTVGNVLYCVRRGNDLTVAFSAAPGTDWRIYRDTTKTSIATTPLGPDVAAKIYDDFGVVPAAAGTELYYNVRAVDCMGNPGL